MPATKNDRPRNLSPAEHSELAHGAAQATAAPQPTATPDQAGRRVRVRRAGTAPTLSPPEQSQAAASTQLNAAAAGGASAWTTVAALWSINQADNAWFYDANVGWVKISPDSDIGVQTVNAIAAHAKALGSPVQYVTDGTTGMVTEITCF
jgi:hypothetical protein